MDQYDFSLHIHIGKIKRFAERFLEIQNAVETLYSTISGVHEM